jgi:proteasome lid subunit RPN8/RPN11
LHIPRRIHDEMMTQAQAERPHECCGLLAGRLVSDAQRAEVMRRYPLVNSAASPVEYRAEGKDLFEAVRDMRRHDWEVLAIYHSHPTCPAIPSGVDLARNYWPGVMCLIISLQSEEPVLRGWWLEERSFQRGEWVLVD